MFSRFGDRIRLKQIDFSGRFPDWQTALRYADILRHHNPIHFEQPSWDLRVCAEFTRRMDLPVSLHTATLERGLESIERGACTAFKPVQRLLRPNLHPPPRMPWPNPQASTAPSGTDQESTLGTAGQLHLGASMPNLSLPCDPMGPMLYTASPAKERIHAEGSFLTVPDGPGLGIELDDDKMAAITVASA